MDPDANLKEQFTLARAIVKRQDAANAADAVVDFEAQAADAERLAELVLALDEWIRSGGFLPAAWNRGAR